MWGITGTGYVLKESIELMRDLQENYDVNITLILSKEGAAVVKWYKLWLDLTKVVE
ncbi:MAG: archaeoflavoprotein AfpA, partial [Promethearchaeota archaeon]